MRSWLKPASNLRRRTSTILRMALRLAGIPLLQEIGEGSPRQWKSSADPRFVPLARDHRFRIVTAVSARGRKSVTMERNRRSRCSGIRGHVQSEIAVTILRNHRSRSIGILGHVGPAACARSPSQISWPATGRSSSMSATISPAISFERVLASVKARYVVGLTATPQRRDGRHPMTQMQLGPVRFTVNAKTQASQRPFEHRSSCARPASVLRLLPPTEGSKVSMACWRGTRTRNAMILNDVIRPSSTGAPDPA